MLNAVSGQNILTSLIKFALFQMKEWLCLNCQVQRALGASEPPGTPVMNLRASPNKSPVCPDALKTKTMVQQNTVAKESTPSGSTQQKSEKPAEKSANAEDKKRPESQERETPEAGQKSIEQDHKKGQHKPPDQTSQTDKKKGITSTKEENEMPFKSGASKAQPDASKPAESLGGKMFGFGSSMFSTASNFITTAVQDESKAMAPVSPKSPITKGTKLINGQKHDSEKKPEQGQQTKSSPMMQAKVEKGPPEHVKDSVNSDSQKVSQSTCPLCKTELNIVSKDPPNYNKCTECKTTVCNQCGFTPMPNVSEVIII